jgi:hypothetical protein
MIASQGSNHFSKTARVASKSLTPGGRRLFRRTSRRSTTVTNFTSAAVTANDIYAIVLYGITGSPTFLQAFVGCDQ